MNLSKENLKKLVASVHESLNKIDCGGDSWPAFPDARAIVESAFHYKLNVIQLYKIVSGKRKKSEFVHQTGNTGANVKGGKNRQRFGRQVPRAPKAVRDYLMSPESGVGPGRGSWIQSDKFLELRDRFPQSEYPEIDHIGVFIPWVNNAAKQMRKKGGKEVVYFMRDPAREDEYNIGKTSRTPEERLKDAGGKGRYQEVERVLEDVPERDVHKLLKPWHDTSRRGAENFRLDAEARQLVLDTYGITLP